MLASHSFSSSPTDTNFDRPQLSASSDDDADTASQRSVSLSSGPSSPVKDSHPRPSSPSLKTPMNGSFAQHTPAPQKSPEPTVEPTSPKELSGDHEGFEADHDANSVAGTGTSGPPSAVTSLKFDGDSTRPSSTSSRTSFLDHNEDTQAHKLEVIDLAVETVHPPHSLNITPDNEHKYPPDKGVDQESLVSATSGRKTRPESILLEHPDGPLVLGIALVDFNHIVGPRVEFFEGPVFEDEELIRILPFLALPDGVHISSEDYSYFHLVPSGPKPTTIFGISCNRQIASSDLLSKGEDVTRSMVQKSVVILTTKPVFGAIRDKLGVVTNAFFNQRDFREITILTDFIATLERSLRSQLTESGLYMGTSIRELIHKFRHRTLILIKALILQRKIMFYGHPVDQLCRYQYSLVSLIPMLLQALEDSGSPPLAARAQTLSRPTSLRTSDRKSLLAFVGLPLDVFGKDSFFQPYLPLQQVDIAKDSNSWLCGCTNTIVCAQSNYDLLVNIETNTFDFQDAKLEKLVALTPADRKWIDDLVKDVSDGWNPSDPTRPAGMQFKGSDDYLRTKFEEYVSGFLATIKYSDFIAKGNSKDVIITGGVGTESQQDFNAQWLAAFRLTQAFETWDRVTDPMLFDIVEPRHPCVDKPTTVTDIGLRFSESVRELKIEQQFAPTREAISNAFATGSMNFFKAVDGIKGRWPVSRTPSTASVNSASSSQASSTPTPTPNAESAKSHPEVTAESASSSAGQISTQPTPVQESKPRPASQLTSDARTAIGAWGSSVGSFFSSRASRFSLGRQSISTLGSIISAPAVPEKPVSSSGGTSKEDAHPPSTVATSTNTEQTQAHDATSDGHGVAV